MIYIWRDMLDKNQFWIGVKNGGGQTYSGWLPVFVDALDDCFGKGTLDKVRHLNGGVPMPIRLTFETIE